jgi:predicted ester cyclase
MAVEENKAPVRRFYEEVWDRGNVEFAHEVFADDYLRHDLRPTAAAPGPQGQRQIAAAFRAAFPDLRWHVDLLLAEGDLVAGRWTASGTNTGPWAGVAATGKHATFSGVNISRIRDGRSWRSGTTVTTLASRSSWGHRSTRARRQKTITQARQHEQVISHSGVGRLAGRSLGCVVGAAAGRCGSIGAPTNQRIGRRCPHGASSPCSLADLLCAFRGCFTAPTLQTFTALVAGFLAQPAQHT